MLPGVLGGVSPLTRSAFGMDIQNAYLAMDICIADGHRVKEADVKDG